MNKAREEQALAHEEWIKADELKAKEIELKILLRRINKVSVTTMEKVPQKLPNYPYLATLRMI